MNALGGCGGATISFRRYRLSSLSTSTKLGLETMSALGRSRRLVIGLCMRASPVGDSSIIMCNAVKEKFYRFVI